MIQCSELRDFEHGRGSKEEGAAPGRESIETKCALLNEAQILVGLRELAVKRHEESGSVGVSPGHAGLPVGAVAAGQARAAEQARAHDGAVPELLAQLVEPLGRTLELARR